MAKYTKDGEKDYYMPSWWRMVGNESVGSVLPKGSSDLKSRTYGRSVCSKLDEELFQETEKALSRTHRNSKEGFRDLDKTNHSRNNHTVKLEKFLANVMEANADSRHPFVTSMRSNGVRESKEQVFSNRAKGRLSALQNSLSGLSKLPSKEAYHYGDSVVNANTSPFFMGNHPDTNKPHPVVTQKPVTEHSLRLAAGTHLDLNNKSHLSQTFRGSHKPKDTSSEGRLC